MGCVEYILILGVPVVGIGLTVFPVLFLSHIERITNSNAIGTAILVWVACLLINGTIWSVNWVRRQRHNPPLRGLPRKVWWIIWAVELAIMQVALWLPYPPSTR